MKTPILAYHKTDDRLEWGITSATHKQFARQMDFLYRNKYQTVGIDRLPAGENNQEKTCCITFDDSYRSLYDNALPVMKNYGYKAAVFVISGSVGKQNDWDVNFFWRKFGHLDWPQLGELAKLGYTIGSHTVTHRDLTMLPGKEIVTELETSKKYLEDRLGVPVDHISYPFGKTNADICRRAREAGYTAGFTMRGRSEPPMAIRRRGVYRIDTLGSFKRKLETAEFNFEDLKGSVINWFSQGTPVLRQRILQH